MYYASAPPSIHLPRATAQRRIAIGPKRFERPLRRSGRPRKHSGRVLRRPARLPRRHARPLRRFGRPPKRLVRLPRRHVRPPKRFYRPFRRCVGAGGRAVGGLWREGSGGGRCFLELLHCLRIGHRPVAHHQQRVGAGGQGGHVDGGAALRERQRVGSQRAVVSAA